MDAGDDIVPDWRDAAAYAPLRGAERAVFAWEWLRRDPVYRAASAAARGHVGEAGPGGLAHDPHAARWGLHVFEPADRACPAARPVWRREVHPYVLRAEARPAGAGEECLDLRSVEPLVRLVRGRHGRGHLLLSDGARSIRLDVDCASALARPVALAYRLGGFSTALPPIMVLRRLIALQARGRFSEALHPPDPRSRRRIALLRAHDALAAGASQREIAACLFDELAARRRWRVNAPHLRSRVQRLVRAARQAACGAYLGLLAPPGSR